MCTQGKRWILQGVAEGKSQANCMIPLWEGGWKKNHRWACFPAVREITMQKNNAKRNNEWQPEEENLVLHKTTSSLCSSAEII